MRRRLSVRTPAPTHSVLHVLIITRWVWPAVSVSTATFTGISLRIAAMVLVKRKLKPLLTKPCYLLLKLLKLHRPRQTMFGPALHVVTLTTSQTGARTEW